MPLSASAATQLTCGLLGAYSPSAITPFRRAAVYVDRILKGEKPADLPVQLDHPRLVNQLIGLERRTSRAGKDSIDHVPGGHDDVANAVAGAVVLAAQAAAQPKVPIVSPAFYSKQTGWVGTGAESATGKSATAQFYEYYGGLGGGSCWPGSGPREW